MKRSSTGKTMLSEWPDIQAPSQDDSINVRLADPAHPLDFRVGRDARGRYVFQLDAAATSQLLLRPLPAPAGIEVLRDKIGDSQLRLSMVLSDASDFDIFRVLCADLLALTADLARSDSARGMTIVLDRVTQWQDIFARRRSGVLSRNEVIGLAGELLFLRDLLLPRIDPAAAVSAWRGPFGDEQDFVIGNTIFELKTQTTTADRRMQISSEDQLDTAKSRIVLCQQGIATAVESAPEARSLNELVAELRAMVAPAGPFVADRLELALLESGWDHRSEYDFDRWQLVDRTFYEVREGFPRIVRADLLPGVEEVRYRVRAADCADFRIDVEVTLNGLLG